MDNNQYRRSLTPFPFIEGKNSKFRYTSSKWLAKGLDIIFWLISTLMLVLAIAIFSSNIAWSVMLVICAVLICPLVPIHFVAKLVACVFAVFPPAVALSMAIALGTLWIIAVLRGPLSDSDA